MREIKGLDGSNSPLSANESQVYAFFGNHRKNAASTRDARRQPRGKYPSRSPLNQTGGQFYFEDWSEPLKLDS